MNDRLLVELEKLLAEIPKSVPVFVFGGFAVDGHHGSLTREHSDVDLLCWRRDVDAVREAMKRAGHDTELFSHPQDSELVYKFNTKDTDKTFGCQIIDEAPDGQFQISFWHFSKQLYPLDYIDPLYAELSGVSFPVVSLDFTRLLKDQEISFYNELKEEYPEKFARREEKYKNCLHDIKILSGGEVKVI